MLNGKNRYIWIIWSMDEKWEMKIFREGEKVVRRWDKNMGYVW